MITFFVLKQFDKFYVCVVLSFTLIAVDPLTRRICMFPLVELTVIVQYIGLTLTIILTLCTVYGYRYIVEWKNIYLQIVNWLQFHVSIGTY